MSSPRTMQGVVGLLRSGGKASVPRSAPRFTSMRPISSSATTSASRVPSTASSIWRSTQSHSRTSAPPRHVASSRTFSTTAAVAHGHFTPPKPGEEVYVTFIEKDGTPVKLAVNVGDDLLSIAQEFDIEMEGACEGSCSCSTCHVIVQDEAMYDKLEEADDEENDMLDIAFGLTETSRLGCQIKMTKELDGLVVKLPLKTRNMQASDFK